MLRHPWDVVFLVGFVVYAAIRQVYASRLRDVKTTERRVDGLEIGLLAVVFVGSLLIPILYLFTPVLRFADYPLPPFVPWIGTAVMALALWLFQRSHADLGKNWSVTLEIREDHQLITGGVYRSIRHPMYAAIWLFSLAQAMLLSNWLAGFAALVSFAPMYLIRTPREERLLCDTLGDEYREYMARTGRIVPRWSGKVNSEAREKSVLDPRELKKDVSAETE